MYIHQMVDQGFFDVSVARQIISMFCNSGGSCMTLRLHGPHFQVVQLGMPKEHADYAEKLLCVVCNASSFSGVDGRLERRYSDLCLIVPMICGDAPSSPRTINDSCAGATVDQLL